MTDNTVRASKPKSTWVTRVVSAVGSLVGLAGLAFVVRIIVREWPQVRTALADADIGLLVLAVLVCGCGMGWIGFQWSAILRALGESTVRRSDVLRAYFIGQMGKYVPGGLWPVLGRAELLARSEVARSIAYPSVGLSMAITYVAAVVVTALAAPWALLHLHLQHGWVVAIAPLGILLLHPAILRKAIALAEKMFSGGAPVRVPGWRASMMLLLRHLPAWLLISLSTWLCGQALGANISVVAIAYATPLSWSAGLVAVPVPGGIGVREAVFLALLAGAADSSTIATVAIVSRLAFVLADVVAALVAGALSRWSRRSAALTG